MAIEGRLNAKISAINAMGTFELSLEDGVLRKWREYCDMPGMNSRIIYSTGVGSLCPNCRRPVRECVCPKGAPGAAKPAAVRVGREIKGRAGKGVTTVTGLPMSLSDIESLATRLKKRCGSGGTVREGVIEIQGDHRDVIVAELVKLGWPAKKSGG